MNLVIEAGKAMHFDLEIARSDYEWMIRPLLDSTLDSVSRALDDAGKTARDLDAIILVGGSTRTPLVPQLLRERTGLEPLQDVHPELCVALGAGVLASRLAGHGVDRVLLDVSPYSFGPSFLGMRGGAVYPHCYKPVIRRNSPLPITRTESYYTAHPRQTTVDIELYQGDDDDALKNIPVGRFRIDGLRPIEEMNEVLCRMSLDLDGILHVTAIEKETGKSKHITIKNAFASKTPAEIAAARQRLAQLWAARETDFALDSDDEEITLEAEEVEEAPAELPGAEEAARLLERSRRLLGHIHSDDVEELIGLHERIDGALKGEDAAELERAVSALRELLFFLEGK